MLRRISAAASNYGGRAIGFRTQYRQTFAAVRQQEVEIGSERHDASRIDCLVALIIVPFDMREIRRSGDSGILIKLTRETPKIGVVYDPPQIAFEVSHVDSVESHQGGEQPPICFRQAFAAKISM